MKIKFFNLNDLKQENMESKRKGLLKGSPEASAAARKAAETRARNKELNKQLLNNPAVADKLVSVNGVKKRNPKVNESIKTGKITFKKLDESNYQKLSIDTPVDIYFHKTLNTMYITPQNTVITKS